MNNAYFDRSTSATTNPKRRAKAPQGIVTRSKGNILKEYPLDRSSINLKVTKAKKASPSVTVKMLNTQTQKLKQIRQEVLEEQEIEEQVLEQLRVANLKLVQVLK